MELFTPQFATNRGYGLAEAQQEFPPKSEAPLNRLTHKELNQIRAIREEIELRPRLTRFEERYIRVLIVGEQEFCGIRTDCIEGITAVRELLKELEFKTEVAERSIFIALLVGAIAKVTKPESR
ncbi:MAG: hypothetical protein C0469_14050 [Cyanobacteria bacterium DS2.3.42]|nr:hypothetical protein [Cyanobacteria bacterium DS2.3.42]